MLQARLATLLLAAATTLLLLEQVEAQPGICYTSNAYTATYSGSTPGSYTSYYSYSCGWWGWSRCYGSYTSYYTTYYTAYQIQYNLQSQCCSGYSGNPPSCNPICSSGCFNGGVCVAPNSCSCTSEWTGSSCTIPICNPACAQGSCTSPGVCTCDAGWTGATCNEDVFECGTDNAGCEQNCHNTIGSYYCSCDSGYTLDGDSHGCTDIDECLTNNGGCDQLCINTAGSFDCDCNIGFELNGDGYNCDDIDECALGTAGCNQICTNTIGSFECSCETGYFLDSDDITCFDHDECANPNHHQCDHICHNIPGSYECSCQIGYRLQPDGYTCLDINECAEEIAGCNHICTNNIGSFVCSCYNGYHLLDDDRTCVDTNECLTDNGGCDHNCTNEIGSFYCWCKDGYTLQDDGFTCVADPCVSIFAPLNGYMDCTGLQVTDQSCSFTCELGYNLTGSDYRLCLPDHTWTGELTECPPLECGELANPENGVILLPCYDEYNETCTVTCEQGYYINGTEFWTQTCVLKDPKLNEVEWTEPPVCIEVLPCDPNPCLHGGLCSVSEEDSPLCNCTGTLYKGDNCETGLLILPEIPILEQGIETENFVIQAAPDTDLNIGCNLNYQLDISPSAKLVILGQENETSFTLTPQISGLFTISYSLYGPALTNTNFETPENSVLLVKPSTASGTSDYFSTLSLPKGELGVGCCKHEYSFPIPTASCSNVITLSASCNWDNQYGDLVTSGVVFISSEGLDLPVSISGIGLGSGQGTFGTYLPSNFQGGTRECSECTACTTSQCSITDSSNTGCKGWSQSVPFNEANMQSMLLANAMPVTFLKKVGTIFPDYWLSVAGNGGTASDAYSLFDYNAFIGSSSEAVKLFGCESLPVASSGLAYTLRTNSELSVYIWQEENLLNLAKDDNTPLCFSLDLCLGQQSPLYVSVPKGLHSLILSQPQFAALVANGWEIELDYIQFQKYGINTPQYSQLLISSAYVSGIQVPSSDVKLYGRVTGSLYGGNLSLSTEFSGSLFYKANVYGKQVPGQINADSLELSISTIVNNETVTLYLSSEEQPFAFDYPGSTTSSSSPLSSGASSQLTYQYAPYSDAGFFSELLMLPGYTSECPLDLYIQLTSTLEVDWVTFASSCIGLRIGKLQFLSTFTHYGEIQGASTSTLAYWNNSITTNSILTSPSVQLGSFVELFKDPSQPCLTLSYSSSSPDVTGVIRNANISVFDTELSSDVTINGEELSFEGDAVIYKHYPVSLTGSSETGSTWDQLSLKLEGTLKESFVYEMNTYLVNHVTKEVNNTKIKQNNAKLSMDNAKLLMESLTEKLSVAAEKVANLTADYNNAILARDSAEVEANNAEDNYQQQLAAHMDSEELVDQISSECPTGACEYICVPGYNCTTCYQDTTMGESGTCTVYELQTTYEKIYFPYQTIGWRYEKRSYSCWLVIRTGWWCTTVIKTCYQTVCVSYIKWAQKPMTISTQTVVAKEKPCQVAVYNLDAPSDCCQQYPCSYTVPDPQCVQAKQECQDKLEEAKINLGALGDSLSDLYSAYLSAKEMQTAAEVLATSTLIELESAEQELALIEPAYDSALLSYDISVENYNKVLQDTAPLAPLINLHDTLGVEQLRFMTLYFGITISTETPLVFPLDIVFSEGNASYPTSALINFDSPKDIIKRDLAIVVVDAYLEVQMPEVNVGRKKRNDPGVGYSVFNVFQEKCAGLKNVYDYFHQLSVSVNASVSSLQETLSVLYNVSENASALMNYSQSIPNAADIYASFAANTSSASESVMKVAEGNSFPQWQTAMQQLHNSTASVGGTPCSGFVDCLQTATDIVQTLLEDSPGDEAKHLLDELLGNRDGLMEVGFVKDMSIEEAQNRLLYILEIVNSTDDLGYWCAEPPSMILDPLLEVNISMGTTLNLSCEADSTLPVRYKWKKDGLYIGMSEGPQLLLPDIEMVDAGEYACIASNDVGSTTSLASSVNVYYAPIFNGTISDTNTIEGNDNGVNLACDAHSWPPPGWKWFYRQTEWTEWQEIPGVDANILPLINPRLEDEGWYMCVAENWMGNASSDPIYLTVLPVKVVRIRYPITFNVSVIGESNDTEIPESAYGSAYGSTFGSGDLQSLLLSFTKQAVSQAFRDALNLYYTVIENIEVHSVAKMPDTLTIAMDLMTPDIVLEDIAPMTVEDILNEAAPAMMELGEAVEVLKVVYPSEEIVFEDKTLKYATINTTLEFGTRAFACPPGNQLHDSLILCVACAPGSYGGPPIVTLTDLGDGQFGREEMPQCLECPIATFQDEKSSEICENCPELYSTLSMASTKNTSCLSYCQPATYSQTGLEPCTPCPSRNYQLEYGATGCLPCPSHDDISHVQCYIPPSHSPSPSVLQEDDNTTNIIIIASASAGVAVLLLIIIVVVIVSAATYHHRQKYKIKNNTDGRRTSTVFDTNINTEGLPQEFGKAKKLRIHSRHEAQDPEKVPLYYNQRGSLVPSVGGEEILPINIAERDMQNPLYEEHEADEVEQTDADVLNATATTQLITGQK